jgi:hypothetical protein
MARAAPNLHIYSSTAAAAATVQTAKHTAWHTQTCRSCPQPGQWCMCARKLRRHQCKKGPPGDDGAHPGWQSPAHACSRSRATLKQLIHSNFKLNCNIVKHYLRAIWGGGVTPSGNTTVATKTTTNSLFNAERQHKQMGGPSWLNTTQHKHPKPRYSHSLEQACSATMRGKRPNLLPTAHVGTRYTQHNTKEMLPSLTAVQWDPARLALSLTSC